MNAPYRVSSANLLAYADDRLRAAGHFPKARLIRRDFRLAGLDMTVWFTSKALAELCESMLVQHRNETPFRQAAEVFALDAEAEGWEPPAIWDEGAGFSSREFEQILAAGDKRGFYHHDAPSWQFYDSAAAVGVHTLPAPWTFPLGSADRRCVYSSTGPKPGWAGASLTRPPSASTAMEL